MTEQDKLIKFIDTYLQTLSPTEACKEAGYTGGDSLKIASEILTNPEVQELIQERKILRSKLASMLNFSREDLFNGLLYQYSKADKFNRVNEATKVLETLAQWNGLKPEEKQVSDVKLVINNLDETKI